jgi:ubiquinone/menaquinone biosynthesis C-methylase UbiE
MDRDEIRRAWDELSKRYAESRDPTGSDAALVDDLVEELPDEPVVLDVGCGDGARTLSRLPDAAVGIGLDISREGLSLAAERGDAEALVQADMAKIPLNDDTVDGVTAYHSIFHVPREEHSEVYAEFARVLRPDGVLLVTLPGGKYETVRRGWLGGSMFFSTLGPEESLAVLRDAGFGETHRVTVDDPLGTKAEFVFARL